MLSVFENCYASYKDIEKGFDTEDVSRLFYLLWCKAQGKRRLHSNR